MAIIVVGGGARGAGKTALICGLMRALPEHRWTAIKITSHTHGHSEPLYEEKVAGQGTDTARYLFAGAHCALLVTAHEDSLASLVRQILEEHAPQSHLIFESNSILRYLHPDLCLAVASDLTGARKPSFDLVERCADATVTLGGHDHLIEGAPIHFHLASLERISPPMCAWLRERLGGGA
jgi:hypothetical protein